MTAGMVRRIALFPTHAGRLEIGPLRMGVEYIEGDGFFGRRRRAMWGAYGHGYGPWAQAHAARSAESTLAERYAQGDIDEKWQRAMAATLAVVPTRCRSSGPGSSVPASRGLPPR